ncbi:MAG TPA: hypothetical protein VGI56_13915 [Galbitalea sp.]|jgi:hypothetical protein
MTATGRTIDDAIAWVAAHPSRHKTGAPVGSLGGGPWATTSNSWCEQLVNNAGGFSEAFATAWDAALASGPLDRNLNTAVKGELLYFSGGAGHIGFYLGGGVMECASTLFAGNGTGFGKITVEAWLAHFGGYHTFAGHSHRHGSQTLKTVPVPPVPVDPHNKGAILYSGQQLNEGDFLEAGAYRLVKQSDSHLVEYRGSRPVWSTSMSRTKLSKHPEAAHTANQPDGNFVDYGSDRNAKQFVIWATGTNQKAYRGSHVKLVPDGRLIIIRPNGQMKTIITAR